MSLDGFMVLLAAAKSPLLGAILDANAQTFCLCPKGAHRPGLKHCPLARRERES